MISLFRVDCRLIHYQTASMWPKKVDANMILVASDTIFDDAMRMGMFKVMVPSSIKLQVLKIDDAINYLLSEEALKPKIELVVESIEDAKRILDAISTITKLQVAIVQRPNGKQISKYLIVNDEDIEILKLLCSSGKEIECCCLTTDKSVPISKLI